MSVDVSKLADANAVRLRHSAAIKKLGFKHSFGVNASETDVLHSTLVPDAVASMVGRNPDLQRSMSRLTLSLCCTPSLLRVVPSIAACSGLTSLFLAWCAHKRQCTVPSDMLAPLSALPQLKALTLVDGINQLGLVAPPPFPAWPALPDAPRLTLLELYGFTNFVFVGSDAALGRLQALRLYQTAASPEAMATEDPLFLRAALDKGTWQPHRLTGLQEIQVDLQNNNAFPSSFRLPRSRSRAGAEWAPLAAQVTDLHVSINVEPRVEPSTGIVAGLGALTALCSLRVMGRFDDTVALPRVSPLALDRVRAPHLTHLCTDWITAPLNLTAFPSLKDVMAVSCTLRQAPVSLWSLVSRPLLQTICLANYTNAPPVINLAQLFVGGGGLPALRTLTLTNFVLDWDTTGLANTPSAAEFATRVQELLPSIDSVDIMEAHGRNALPDRAHLVFVMECRLHVVPALRARAPPLLPGSERVRLQAAGRPAPPPPDPHRDAGNAAYREGRWADAIDAYTRAAGGAARGSPAWVAAVNNRAAAKLAAGDAAGAQADGAAVLTLEPRNVKALLRCAAARERLGDVATAVNGYEAVLVLDPGCEQAREGLARLRRR